MNECIICGRDKTSSDFCAYHNDAFQNLKNAFGIWKNALEIEWAEFITLIEEEEALGKWAREVVEYLMKQNDS